MDRKKITLLIGLLLFVGLIVGGTFAYWTWNSTENKSIVFNTVGNVSEYIVYDEGSSYFLGDFKPTDSYCQSVNTTISLKKTAEANNIALRATINMDVNAIGPNIANSSDVYWVVTKGDSNITCSDGLSGSNVLGSGTFFGKTVDETFKLVSDLEVTTTEEEYTIWIWINSNGTDLSKLSGETVDTNIWTQIDMVDPDEENDVENDRDIYTVTYNVNGGINGPTNQEKTAGEDLILSSTQPTRNGYTFSGWNTIPNGTGISYTGGATYSIDADLILYAVWIPNTYTISYDSNGGTGGSTAITSCSYGKSCTLRNNGFTKTGYTFIGWTDIENGTDVVYKDGATILLYDKTSNMTLYALWKINTYTISYHVEFGSGYPNDQTKIYDETLTISSTKPIREDYEFVEWNTESDGTGTSYKPGDSYSANANITLHAQWRFITGSNKVTIYYNVNGGTVTPNATYIWSSDANGRILTEDYAVKNEVEIGSMVNLNNNTTGSLMEILKSGETATDDAEWICLSGCTTANKTFDQDVDYAATDFCDVTTDSCEVELGVNWRENKVIINYSVNGGIIATSSNSNGTWSTIDSLVYKNGNLYFQQINFGSQLDSLGLVDWNNSSNLNISKSGYIAQTGLEWKCLSGCTTSNALFHHETAYLASDFCNASNGDCTVVLGVNWVDKTTPALTASPNPLYITLAAIGSGTITYTYDGDGTITCASENTSIATCSVNTSAKTVTVTANAQGNTNVTVYASEGATYKSDSETVEVIVSLARYNINYNACSGTGIPDNQTKIHGETLKLSSTVPTRAGYTFKGWATEDAGGCNATSATYAAGANYTTNAAVTLYAVWEANSYTLTLAANDGGFDAVTYTTSGEYTYVVPTSGTYKLEVWGAQGGTGVIDGTSTYRGGYGGYSVGTVSLNSNSTLYLYVGGKGANATDAKAGGAGGYNGGGTGGSDSNYSSSGGNEPGAGGGGATHIATASGLLSTLSSNTGSILIVAGGGGGGAYDGVGGNGGGYTGGSGNVSTTVGTQSSGNAFGKGGAGVSDTGGSGGGGSGYYGGKGGPANGDSGAGGSGYIGNSLLTDKAMYCYNCTTSSGASTLTYSTTNVSAAPIANYAKSGAGAIKISRDITTMSVTYETVYGTLPTPTREGYVFAGWNTSADGSGTTITSSTQVTSASDHTLYAIWDTYSFATYISEFVYTSSSASTVSNNSITYYRDTTDLIMNDGFGTGATNVSTSGNLRYYGGSPNNYVYFNCDTYPYTNCETWRIIGVFTVNGTRKVKLMRGNRTGNMVYDNYPDAGTKDWAYARTMALLNPAEYSTNLSSSRYAYTRGLYYNRASGTCYYSSTANYTANGSNQPACNFTSTGLKNDITRNMVSASTYYRGSIGSSAYLYPNQFYDYERSGSTWTGKIALLYASDYGYATDLGVCTKNMREYSQTAACYTGGNWMESIFDNDNFTNAVATMTGSNTNYQINAIFGYQDTGQVQTLGAMTYASLVPVLYLDEDVVVVGGDGSSSNPYQIQLN